MRNRFIVFIVALVLAASPCLAAASPTPTPSSLGDQLLNEARQVFNYLVESEMTENNPWYDYLQAVLSNASWGLVPSPAPAYSPTPTPDPSIAYLQPGMLDNDTIWYIWQEPSFSHSYPWGGSAYPSYYPGGTPPTLSDEVYSRQIAGSSNYSLGSSYAVKVCATLSSVTVYFQIYTSTTPANLTATMLGPQLRFSSSVSGSASAVGHYFCGQDYAFGGSSSGLLSADRNSSGAYVIDLGSFTVPSDWYISDGSWYTHELITIYLNGTSPSSSPSVTSVPSVPIPDIVMPQRDNFPEGSEGDYYYDQSMSIYNRVIQLQDDLTINVPSMPYDSLVPDLDTLKDYKLFALPIQMAQDIYDTCISGYSSTFDFNLDIPENSILNFPDVSISLDPRTLFGSFWNFITYVFSFFAFLMLFSIIFNSVVGGNDNA